MALAFDAYSGASATFTTVTNTWTHTPVGTPAAVCLCVIHDALTGWALCTVTYGGVSMTASPNGQGATAAQGVCDTYYLVSGIPTGPQTVSVAANGSTTVKHAGVITAIQTEGGSALFDSAQGGAMTGTTQNAIQVTFTHKIQGWFGMGGIWSSIILTSTGIDTTNVRAGGFTFAATSHSANYVYVTDGAATNGSSPSQFFGWTTVTSSNGNQSATVIADVPPPSNYRTHRMPIA